jgi:adenylosuccinate lyase
MSTPQPTASAHQTYDNPLAERYASRAMLELWSPQRKFSTWRRLWVALAEVQRELGLAISEAQIRAMSAHVETIDFAAAQAYETTLRHDVMAHVHAFGDQVPEARPIIHLGATSCYVTDNTDLILMRDALGMIRAQVAGVILTLGDFARRWRDLPCLGYTHFQPAQPLTVGKRATLWAYDLVHDLAELDHRIDTLAFLGVKGTTGTQNSFLALFNGDHDKVRELDRRVAARFGFERLQPVSGQTYTRKLDARVLETLAGIAESGHRFGCDIRLLAHERELREPFESRQIGSSAMAYKRNPMRAERLCSLARYLRALPAAASETAATQWLERTLDDSAIRRIILPQGFLAADACLSLHHNIAAGLEVNPAVVARNLQRELPFMATEAILMAGVTAGGDRQELHERIRVHSLAAADRLDQGERDNDLLERLANDPAFAQVDLVATLDPRRAVGRSPQQVDEFLETVVEPLRARFGDQRPTGRSIEV